MRVDNGGPKQVQRISPSARFRARYSAVRYSGGRPREFVQAVRQ